MINIGSTYSTQESQQECILKSIQLLMVTRPVHAYLLAKVWNRFVRYLVNWDESQDLSYPPPTS